MYTVEALRKCSEPEAVTCMWVSSIQLIVTTSILLGTTDYLVKAILKLVNLYFKTYGASSDLHTTA